MTSLDWRKPVCGWCNHEAESREAQRAHAMVCPESPVVTERNQLRESLSKHLEVSRLKCDVHFGARTECGQCYSSLEQHLANARTEAAEFRAELALAHAERDDARGRAEALSAEREAYGLRVAEAVREVSIREANAWCGHRYADASNMAASVIANVDISEIVKGVK